MKKMIHLFPENVSLVQNISLRKMRSFPLIALLLASVLSCTKNSSTSSGGSQPVYVDALTNGALPVADSQCANFQAKIPHDWFQGTLQVPEDSTNPNSPIVNVFYYGKINPNSIPTVYFNGGPGSDDRGDYSILTGHQSMFDPDHHISFVFIDQRGNGCSSGFPQGTDRKTLRRLSFYGSRGIVEDAEQVRAKVWPGKPWIVAGQSFGGFVVHRYLMLHPEAISTAISQEEVLTDDAYTRAKMRIESQARVMGNYLQEFPEDAAALALLRSYLTPDRCYKNSEGTEKRCGLGTLTELVDLLDFTDNWIPVHGWIGLMATSTVVLDSGIQEFLNKKVFAGVPAPKNNKRVALYLIGWVDRNVLPLNSYNCKKIQSDALLQDQIDLNTAFLNECMYSLQIATDEPVDDSGWLHQFPQDMLTVSGFVSQLQSHPNIPFYLYSANLDVFVPISEFTSEVNALTALPQAHYTSFVGTGHDSCYDEAQTWQDWIRASTP